MTVKKMMTLSTVTMATWVVLGFGNVDVLAGSNTDPKVGSVVEDSMITTRVKSQMVIDSRVSALDIGVKTNTGVVQLTGEVGTHAEASAAIEIAAGIVGVVDVDASELVIRSDVQENKQALQDTLLTAKIKGRFIREKIFGDKPISVVDLKVDTKNGVVSLSGTVDDMAQAENAEKLAKTVEGVESVVTNVTVRLKEKK